ncbi:RsmB/NOP family class I SAM-dependent RNA methyltransferase [Roseateles sp. DAIF2]|uniref:RsmB/NOP family class I SAM-dependent RNA methyltransferase n=1 Tax=Roseateles sp. DAIF2 TaxID=2714952 RepID=UPI0018A32B9A|nr:RsmB/NOP family class I SAM-dependent RNA methyltransferase [Roseateles sp. DAIF2]QPF74385.1 RsmB/NOP family class I SAM-dependent RNA methyltransferase [Roseateles sp. DAIF2]
MHPNALLDLSTELLRAVLKFDAPADGVVSAFFRKHKALGQRERHTLAETVYTVLRQRPLLQHLAQSGSGAIERRLSLLAWQGSETFLRGALAPHEQEWLAQVKQIDRASLAPKLRHNLPDWLAEPLLARLGEPGFWALAGSMNEGAPLDLRVNTLKAKREEVQAALLQAGIEALPTPYSPLGLRVEGKPALTKLDVFAGGAVEVQDEGSQLLALMLDAKRGEMVVDFCAGAGGKTLALGAAMRNTGRLYAFDVSGHRLDNLKPRLARSGLSNVHPAQIVHERDERIKRLAGKIDRVLVDAPCSGLGTLRRNPDLKWRQSPQAVVELQAKQRAILDSAARLLKPGGRLVYATCSLLEAENEQIARAFGEAHQDFVSLDAAEVLEKAHVARAGELVEQGFVRLWPQQHRTDGFFAAVWERKK